MELDMIILTLHFVMSQAVSAYEQLCPYTPHRVSRAKGICHHGNNLTTNYTCLFNTNNQKYIEFCNITTDFTAPGEKYVFTGRRRNVECPDSHYQPFSLWSNASSECLFKKSTCADDEQFVNNNGTTIQDRSCRCDYTRGFDFVSKPENPCYCIPSKEDCSCYRRDCQKGYILNSDYMCSLYSTDEHHICQEINAFRTGKNYSGFIIYRHDEKNEKGSKNAVGVTIITGCVVLCILYLLVCCIVLRYVELKDDDAGEPSKIEIKLVASIDLGTTYTGYASSTINCLEDNTLEINVNPKWYSGTGKFYSLKTPTCVLLTEQDKFVALGYQAQREYAQVLLENKSNQYRYFEKFKMELYGREDISEQMDIKDFQGYPAKAKVVFSSIIKELVRRVQEDNKSVKPDEIKWVITVPALWSEKAKDFMRTCAKAAGIDTDRLLIALEAEAVSVYFSYANQLPNNKDVNYLVVDIGGGTVDTTAHQKTKDGRILELCPPVGVNSGGEKVTEAFFTFLGEIISPEIMQYLKEDQTYRDSYIDILREIEILKQTDFSVVEKNKAAYFNLPFYDISQLCRSKKLEDIVSESKHCKVVTLIKDKLKITVTAFTHLFDPVIKTIISDVQRVLEELKPVQIDRILLAGGFSSSQIITKSLKDVFPEIITDDLPNPEANLAVVKGAVLYGYFQPQFAFSRRTHYTYGTVIQPLFLEGTHDPNKRKTVEGRDICEDVFDVLVKRNALIEEGNTVEKIYDTTEKQPLIKIPIYKTKKCFVDNDNTKKPFVYYVDDVDCKMFGEIEIDLGGTTRKKLQIIVQFYFGSIEFYATAFDKKRKLKLQTIFKPLRRILDE